MDKARLLESDLPEDEVPLLRGGTVTVRGLSRAEVLAIRKESVAAVAADKTIEYRDISDQLVIKHGLVDPALTLNEVKQWQAGARSGEVDAVIERIGQLTGWDENHNKETYKSFRERPGDGMGVLPSGEAADDGGPAES